MRLTSSRRARRSSGSTSRTRIALAPQGVACCDLVNRGAAFVDGKIIYDMLDVHTVAVDAESGKEVGRPGWATSILGKP
jgi:hypothetical protein